MENDFSPKSKPLKITSIIPYSGSIIIFFGIVRLTVYYRSFNIPIVNYIDFSEVITSFLDILSIAGIFLVFTFYNQFVVFDKTESERQEDIKTKLIEETDKLQMIRLYFSYFKNVFLIVLFLPVFFLFSHFLYEPLKYSDVKMVAVLFLAMLVIAIGSIETEKKHHRIQSSLRYRQIMSVVFTGVIFTGVVIFFAKYEADSIKVDKSTTGTVIFLKDGDVLKSDKENYFIGKTAHYVFVYHEKKHFTDVIPMERVKQISIPYKKSH